MNRRSSDPADPQDAISTPAGQSHLRDDSALKRFIRRFLRNHLDIEDAAQEAFLRTYAVGQNRPIEQPKSLLWRLAKQMARSALHRKARQIADYINDADHSEIAYAGSSPEDELSDQQILGLHCEAVAELRPQCRQVYLLRKVHGLSHKEIAEHLGLSVRTVEKHLMKAVEHCERYVRELIQARKAGTQLPADLERRGG